jgi:hypothetical protein
MSAVTPLRLVGGSDNPAGCGFTVALPAELVDELRDGGTVAMSVEEVFADLARAIHRLRRENGRIRQRLAAVERLLSDKPTAGARRYELRTRSR